MTKQPIGIPIKVLHESQGSIITILLSNKFSYTGKAEFIDDFMNITLSNVVERNSRNDTTRELNSVFIKGNEVVTIILPKELVNSPSIHNQQQYLSTKRRKVIKQTENTKRVKLTK